MVCSAPRHTQQVKPMKWTRSRDDRHTIYRALGITVRIGPVHSYFSVWHDATNLRIVPELPRSDWRSKKTVTVASILAWCEKIAVLVPDWSAITATSANLPTLYNFCMTVPPELDPRRH